jgi:FkbM family methyltransferase
VKGISSIYERVFGRVKNPPENDTLHVGVAIGAFDGVHYDPVLGLALRGWKMVYAEPVAAHINELRRLLGAFPRVQSHQVAIGGRDAQGTAEILTRGVLSTLSDEWKHTMTEGEGFQHGRAGSAATETVQLESAQSLLVRSGVQPGFGVLVVDTEGLEWTVLRGLDLQFWRPVLLIVELGEDELVQSGDMQNTAAEHRVCRNHILSSGYVQVYKDRINSVFARADAATRAGFGS